MKKEVGLAGQRRRGDGVEVVVGLGLRCCVQRQFCLEQARS